MEPDHSFGIDERFFVRFTSADWGEGTPDLVDVIVATLRLPNQSANRSRYSAALDVLEPHWRDGGVYSFPVNRLPNGLQQDPAPGKTSIPPNSPSFDFCACHQPDDANYAHSEVAVYKSEAGVSKRLKNNFASTVQNKAKSIIAINASLEREPNRS